MTLVLSFARMNPPTWGHDLNIKALLRIADERRADHYCILTNTKDHKKNPLAIHDKVVWAQIAWPEAKFLTCDAKFRGLFEWLHHLYPTWRQHLVFVCGADRVAHFTDIINKYNGKETNKPEQYYQFDKVEVVSTGERTINVSGSAMREFVRNNDYPNFCWHCPPLIRSEPSYTLELYNLLRYELRCHELQRTA